MMQLNAVQLRELACHIKSAATNYFRHPQENCPLTYHCDNGLISHAGQFVKVSGKDSIGITVAFHPLVILWQNGNLNSPPLLGVSVLSLEEVSKLVVAAWMKELPEEMIQQAREILVADADPLYSPWILAIKGLRNDYKDLTGEWMTLKDAKDIVDAIRNGDYPAPQPTRQTQQIVISSCSPGAFPMTVCVGGSEIVIHNASEGSFPLVLEW